MLDDLTHEVYVHLWHDDFRVLRRWQRESPLRAYLGTVITRLVWQRLGRFQPARERLVGDQDYADGALDRQQDTRPLAPEEEVTIKEFGRLLRAALEGLTTYQRIVIELRYFHELSYREIAEELRLTPTNIGVRLNRAQACLRQALQRALDQDDWPQPHGISVLL